MWRKMFNFASDIIIKEVRMRFLGNIEAKIDAKGRAFLPASFRKVLQAEKEERLVLRKDVFQPCLVLYPESIWNEQTDALRSRLNRWVICALMAGTLILARSKAIWKLRLIPRLARIRAALTSSSLVPALVAPRAVLLPIRAAAPALLRRILALA